MERPDIPRIRRCGADTGSRDLRRQGGFPPGARTTGGLSPVEDPLARVPGGGCHHMRGDLEPGGRAHRDGRHQAPSVGEWEYGECAPGLQGRDARGPAIPDAGVRGEALPQGMGRRRRTRGRNAGRPWRTGRRAWRPGAGRIWRMGFRSRLAGIRKRFMSPGRFWWKTWKRAARSKTRE